MNILLKSWRGEASLAQAFWLVYIFFRLIVLIVIYITLSLILPNFDFILNNDLAMAILFPFTLFSAICVWRCSKKSDFIWRTIARALVLVDVISGLFHIVQLFRAPIPKSIESTKL